MSHRPPHLSKKPPAQTSIGTWLIAFVLLLFAYQMFFAPKVPKSVKSGAVAPSLQLQQLNDAKQWTPSWGEKVTVLEFWASHCSVCVRKLRSSSRRATRFQSEGIQHLMVNIDSPTSVSALRKYLTRQQVPRAQWHVHQRDARYQGANRYRIRVLPTIVVINKKGKIAQYFQGTLSDSYLRSYIKRIERMAFLPGSTPSRRTLALRDDTWRPFASRQLIEPLPHTTPNRQF